MDTIYWRFYWNPEDALRSKRDYCQNMYYVRSKSIIFYSNFIIQYRYSDAIGPDVFYVEEAQETLKHVQKIGVTTLASKWIMSNTRPEVISYEEHIMTKPSSSITENLFGLIKSSDAQTATSKSSVNSVINKKPQELPSILKKRSPEESPMISGSGK